MVVRSGEELHASSIWVWVYVPRFLKNLNVEISILCAFEKDETVNHFSPTLFMIVAKMSLPKCSAPYWSNSPFSFFDIPAHWRSGPSAGLPGAP